MKEKIEQSVKIYESKKWKIFGIIFNILTCVMIYYLFIKSDNKISFSLYLGIPFLLIMFYDTYKKTKKLKELKKNTKNILVISIDGIKVPIYGFIPWEKIKDEYINAESSALFEGLEFFIKIQTTDNKIIKLPSYGLNKNTFQINRTLKKYKNYYDVHIKPKYN